MFDEYDPSVFYRAFSVKRGSPHIAMEHEGLFRLSSGLFRSSRPISVFDGATTTLREVLTHLPGMGIAAVAKSALSAHGLEPQAEVLPGDLAGHCVLANDNARVGEALTRSAIVKVRVPGFDVRGADGQFGASPPTSE